MRVLLVSSRFWPYTGGVEEFTGSLAGHHQANGHRVEVLAARTSLREAGRQTIRGVNIRRVFMTFWGISAKQNATAAFLLLPGLTSFMQEVHYYNPEVINAQFIDANAFYLWYARKFKKTPLVVTLHGSDVKVFPRRGSLHFSMFRRVLHSADRVIFTSRNLIEHMPESVELPPEKIRVVYNGIDPELTESRVTESDLQPDGPYFYSAGRFVELKGFDVLLEAFAAVADDLPDYRLVIAGDGPMRPQLLQRAKQLGLAERVVLPGFVEHGQSLHLLKQATAAVLPSREENFSIFALEAQVLGAPLIASGVGGLPELITDGLNGITVQSENSQALSQQMKRLASDGDLRKELGEAGRKIVREKFTMEVCAAQTEEIYAEVVKR